ncbi:helicase [bacterium]|nr:helicase [bacterium]
MSIPTDITLSAEQLSVFREIESAHDHFYVTGKAGTGKSTLLQYLRYHTEKKVVVVAPTGIAALNVGAQTIHSFFGIPPGFVARESLQVSGRVRRILRAIEMVIIDEVSMVRADLMDAMDSLLRQARCNSIPFGGVKMVMFGDLYQLPPIVERSLHRYFVEQYGGHYFFDAAVWKETEMAVLELNHIFRQSDEFFKTILNAVRNGQATPAVLNDLNTRANRFPPADGVITLATTNNRVTEINMARINQLPGDYFSYRADLDGAIEESIFPTEELLQLKPGAQVMMLRNDSKKRWVNGTLGRIYSLKSDAIEVEIDGKIYELGKEKWSKIRYNLDSESGAIREDSIGSFTQYPVRLAWAVTIHKAQGLTYDQLVIDLGAGSFAHGQTYVALSRCRTLDGLYLSRMVTPKDIIVDPRILRFLGEDSGFDSDDDYC